ncbi:histidine phosphotransferase family protein [Cochlodiniinecator piscidefendens]|uniref:histidine phosphotransferase family protein n=1 Tax=Cochlodiniinecator piscidefendens TaxID=2715756 RepID=UPI00140AA1CC|nr:histidine phosphotransferase family protein [Cochlodiniinecator piscidefendens]
MSTKELDLAALLGSRICHDLISPLGAIGNGLELLEMTQSANGPELDLVSDSVASANARIKFFRVAFGHARGDQQIADREVRSILAEHAKNSRQTIDWQISQDPLRNLVKIAFLLINCMESATPFGGNVTVSEDNGRWQITATAERLIINSPLWEVLSNPNATHELKPAEVQFALVPLEIQRSGRRLTVEIEESGISVRF